MLKVKGKAPEEIHVILLRQQHCNIVYGINKIVI